MDTITLYDLLHMTHEEITLQDMKRITTRQMNYFKAKYKTPPCCPSCGSILTTGTGYITCDIIAICPACHWRRDNQRLVTLIEYERCYQWEKEEGHHLRVTD